MERKNPVLAFTLLTKRSITGRSLFKRVNIERFDTFDSVLEKDFGLAPDAMLEAIDLIRRGDYSEHLIPNDKSIATYFSKPTLSDAIRYRRVMLSRWFRGA